MGVHNTVSNNKAGGVRGVRVDQTDLVEGKLDFRVGQEKLG